jgi:RNA polymerase sigma-70 factor (ECF subfamily)
MADGAERWSLEEYRAYLRMVARLKLSPELRRVLDSSDLIQQTMLKALEKRDQFRGQKTGEYLAWLRQILAHNVYDQAKKEGLIGDDPVHKVSLERALDESGRRLDELLALDSSPPLGKVIGHEDLVRLEEALEKLPENQRTAVILKKLQGYSLAETSRCMGLSKDAVSGLLVRAMRTLRQHLNESP